MLYRHLVARFPQLKGGPHVAIISPYKQQVKLFRERFKEVVGTENARLIDTNTVDGFQVSYLFVLCLLWLGNSLFFLKYVF